VFICVKKFFAVVAAPAAIASSRHGSMFQKPRACPDGEDNTNTRLPAIRTSCSPQASLRDPEARPARAAFLLVNATMRGR
jgi:hypothetical protein